MVSKRLWKAPFDVWRVAQIACGNARDHGDLPHGKASLAWQSAYRENRASNQLGAAATVRLEAMGVAPRSLRRYC